MAMVGRLKNTVLMLWDNYPDFSIEEANFIEKTLLKEGYSVKKLSINDLLSIGGNFASFYGQVLIVPNCKNLPLVIKTALKTYSERMGNVLYIGGPLFYNKVEKDKNDNFVLRPLENTLDANFNTEYPYIREGIAPSYKTFMAENISKLKTSISQNFYNGQDELSNPLAWQSDSLKRFPLVPAQDLNKYPEFRRSV